jgi:hypothetical protein
MVKYNGQSPIKVHGGTTGLTYVFNGYGYVMAIDDRDLSNVMAIPGTELVGLENQ